MVADNFPGQGVVVRGFLNQLLLRNHVSDLVRNHLCISRIGLEHRVSIARSTGTEEDAPIHTLVKAMEVPIWFWVLC